MANRMKEDEKNEKIIRGLLKLPGNRKCINCNILGPQYVCTTFSTFVCTTCGGIHREFTHRVKSVSMAKFTPQEISSLQAGGNERAKEIYFKDWDSQRQSTPDSSNVDRVRDFIKHVYVDRRYSGDKGSDRPPLGRQGDKEEPIENRRSDGYLSGSRSPTYDARFDRQSSGRSSPGYDPRSPGYDQENQRHSDYGRSPVRSSGIANDWRREDRFSNERKFDTRHSSDGDGRHEISSPDSQKDTSVSGVTSVRNGGEIPGNNVVPPRIEPPRSNSNKTVDGSKNTQRTISSSNLASSNNNPIEIKRATSLIDFDAEPEPPKTSIPTQPEQSITNQSITQSTNTQSDDNWACFDNVQNDNNAPQTPPQITNPLESVLTGLTVPVPGQSSGSTVSNGAPLTSNGVFPLTNSGIYQQSGLHTQQPLTQVPPSQPVASQFGYAFPSGSNNQGLTSNLVAQTPQTVEVKSSDRKELPADLFTATYSFAPYQTPGWRSGFGGTFPGMGFPMQYNHAMSMPAYPQLPKSSNPFDTEGSSVQGAMFPSMSSLHTALPNMAAPRSVAHVPNVGTSTYQWMPPQLPTVRPAGPSFGSAMPAGMYMGQLQPPNMTSSRPQGFGSSVSEGLTFGPLNPAAAIPNPSLGGNPFG